MMTKRIIFLLIGLLLIASLLTAVKPIKPGERAVVRRFGKVTATPEPGLWIGLPWGLDRIDLVSVQVRRVAIGYEKDMDEPENALPRGQFLTGDHNLVNVQAKLDYAADEDQLVDFVEQMDRAEGVLTRAAEGVLAEWLAGRKVDEILIRGQADLPRFLIEQTQERIADNRLGIRIQNANIAYLMPPEQVKADFDDVTRAQTAIHTLENEARQRGQEILRDADRERFNTQKRAEAYRTERLRLAQAEAERFTQRLDTYRHLRKDNPNYLASIWWEEMGKLFANLKDAGRIDLLDNHLAADGLDITVFPPMPGKKK
jgi:membrane protease subunit HflK